MALHGHESFVVVMVYELGGDKESMFHRFTVVTIFSFWHERQISFSMYGIFFMVGWFNGVGEQLFCLIGEKKKKKKKNKDKYRRYINWAGYIEWLMEG